MKKMLTRGMRTLLAEHLNCNMGFISQVLGGDAHFSLEHAMSIGSFFKLSDKELKYFLLLVQKAKAGSYELEKFYQKEIDFIHKSREEISERVVKNKTMLKEDRVTYFSSSYYALIHMALTISDFQGDFETLSNKFNINKATVEKVIDFLLGKGLIVYKNNRYQTGPVRIHLEKSSPLITQHHTNTRVETIKALAREDKGSLHYSGVFAMKESDARAVRKILLSSIEKSDQVIQNSKDEKLYILGMDFFEY